MLLENEQVIAILKDTSWHLKGRSIIRTIKFETFAQAVDALSMVADISMQLNHEPNAEIMDNRLKIILSTAEDGGVTIKDIDMAHKLDKMLGL